MKRFAFPLFALALLAGCATTGSGPAPEVGRSVDPEAAIVPLVDVAKRKAELARLPPDERGRWCRSSVGRAFLARKATIKGRLTRQRSTAQSAGNALFTDIEAYYAGRSDAAKAIRDTLVKGARIDAFSVLVPYAPRGYPGYNKMNEPVAQVANFMVPLAHAYLILKHEYPEDAALVAGVKRWGDRLFEVTRRADDDFRGSHGGIDRRAHIAAGWASWGNAAENRAALDSAYRYFLHALYGTGRGGVDQVWLDWPPAGGTRLTYVNATLQSALVAADALRRSGADDVYTVAPAGGTIVEGVAWFWTAYDGEQPPDLARARHDGSRSVGWIELFLREFPEHPLAPEMDAWLAGNRPLYVNMGGGPTTCLYRSVVSAS